MGADRQIEREEELQESMVMLSVQSITSKVPLAPVTERYCECGEEIHEKRRLAGYSRCVGCVEHEEITAKQFRRN